MNSRSMGHVKSGYSLGLKLSTNSHGGLTTLSLLGHKKKARDFLVVSLFTTALCKQLLYLPFERAYHHINTHRIVINQIPQCFFCLVLFGKTNAWKSRVIKLRQSHYHEGVTNIHNKSIQIRFDGMPLIVNTNLQASHLVLVKNGQRCWITMRSSA